MAVDFLSVFIIIISALGVCGLALIFWHRKSHPNPDSNIPKPNKNSSVDEVSLRTPHSSRNRIEPTVSNEPFSDAAASLGFSTLDILHSQEPKIDPITAVSPAPVVPVSYVPVMPAANKELVLFYLLANENHPFSGYELLQSLLSAGLHFGKMNVFHRHENIDGTGEILFSLASATEPGVFDLTNIGAFSCPGLSLFMLPQKTKNLGATFELMLETAHQLAEDLGGKLYDDERKPLTEHMITQMRLSLQMAVPA